MTRIGPITPTRLEVHSRAGRGLQLALWLAFVGYTFFVMQTEQVRLDRTGAATADLRVSSRLFGFTLSEKRMKGVLAAELEKAPPSNDSLRRRRRHEVRLNETYRIRIRTAAGTRALSDVYKGGLESQQKAVDDINAFLAADAPKHLVTEVSRGPWVWFGFGILAFGAVGSMFGARSTCVVDRAADTVRLRGPGIAFRSRTEFQLSDVESFRVIEQPSPVRVNGQIRPHYTLGMRLRNGDEVSITGRGSSSPSPQLAALAQQLERFRGGTETLPTG